MGQMRRVLCLAFACAALMCATIPAAAVEDGMSPYPKGFVGFMSAFVPPQSGLYLTNEYYYFNGSAGAEVRSGVVNLDINTTLNANFLQGTYVTDLHILGGQYAFGALFGWAWLNLNADLQTRIGGLNVSLNNNSLTDSFITPLILGWHEGNFNWSVGLSIYAPTGFYSRNPFELSIGKNIWAVMPQYGITYFDPKTGLDVSGMFTLVTMTNNSATDYQSGDLLHLDWAIGEHFGDQLAWEAGVAGNLMGQFTSDTGSGAKLGPFKAGSVGLGPALNYSTKIGSNSIVFGAKWEHDLTATNTFKGDVVTANATVSF